MLGTYHLNSLFDILKEIHFIYEPKKLWKYVLEQASNTLQAEGGTFFRANEEANQMFVEAAHGVDENKLKQAAFPAGTGICGWVLQYHQPALVTDVTQDNRFTRKFDALTGTRTRSVLCVPVLSQKQVYGVLEIINRKSGQFNPQDQEFMTVLGRQAAAAYQNLLLFEEVNQSKTLLDSVLSNLSGGLITMNLSGAITVLNPAAERLLNLPANKSVGQTAKVVLMDHPAFLDVLEKTAREKKPVSRQELNLPLQGQDARIGYTTMLVMDKQQNLMGTGIIFQQLPKI